MQYKNIFDDDFQWNQVSFHYFFRSGGGMHPPCVRAWWRADLSINDEINLTFHN